MDAADIAVKACGLVNLLHSKGYRPGSTWKMVKCIDHYNDMWFTIVPYSSIGEDNIWNGEWSDSDYVRNDSKSKDLIWSDTEGNIYKFVVPNQGEWKVVA